MTEANARTVRRPRSSRSFRKEVRAWLARTTGPAKPDFKLPDSFMEVGRAAAVRVPAGLAGKVYEAGYIGTDLAGKEYGGGGKHGAYQGVVNREMGAAMTCPSWSTSSA